MTFTVSHGPVTTEEALQHAKDLETAIGEIGNGKRKASKMPMEPLIALIQFVRDYTKESNKIYLEDGAKIQNLIILLENNQKAYLTELEALRDKANWAAKWRGIAVARDGDGRTVQTIQAEAIAEERKACAHMAAHFTGSYEAGQEGKAIAEAILARGAS